MFLRIFLILLLLCGCVSTWHAPDDFLFVPVKSGGYEIATWQKITNSTDEIHIYIEGDGRSFDSRGRPNYDPTPRGTFLRNIATSDNAANVVYIARPCQFIMSDSCTKSDWTDGRFSQKIIDSMSGAVKGIANGRPIIFIGYSGGAMISGLIIENTPELNVKNWITIAGVLNHADWTEYFGDTPLSHSLDMDDLPQVKQLHYAAEKDEVVPLELTKKWVGEENVIIIKNATHDAFGDFDIDFSD